MLEMLAWLYQGEARCADQQAGFKFPNAALAELFGQHKQLSNFLRPAAIFFRLVSDRHSSLV